MALISMQDVSIGFGGHPLLDEVSFQIERSERVGLLGRNGMGKSTILKMLNGDVLPHDGTIARLQNVRTAYLPQEVPQDLHGRIEDIIASGLIDSDFADDEHHWKRDNQVQKTISLMELDGDARFETLSAGMKRRVILARGLVCNPDLLLLDEPTNHLDIQAIDWLEDFLKRCGGTLVFVTHDRVFLQKLTTRIIELDRGSVYDWACDYPTFLVRKEAMLDTEQTSNVLFDKKLAQEEAWIRKGIEARRTRNEGRVLALKKLRQQRSERRELLGKVKMKIGTEKRSGRLVIEAENISYAYAEKTIIRNFTTTIQRGDKIGIVGANGSGKTTLLKLLMGQLPPQTGEVRHGTNLDIVYFDQLRTQLDESKSVLDNVGQGRDTVTINGRTRNLMGYLEDFLFTRDRVRAPITALSGGERNRLMLARLFALPANLLILDEPTNDLDIETLEILEDMLLDYEGTLLLVSHDRAFLNNIVTSTLILDGSSDVIEFIGGYEDWQKQLDATLRQAQDGASASKTTIKPAQTTQTESKPEVKSRKLSYNEKRELEELPKRIEKLEEEQKQLTLKMEAPSFYQQEGTVITQAVERLEQIHKELSQAYKRWGELEN
ncbi:MAG: ATP-binding cassette domain-containing protein [Anaerolineales bacterium]|nr:ATP-binding cassette domain-containing protein [Anaerolineales bacterium]